MNALSINKLSKTYARGENALKGIDLDIQAGDFFALLGPNGAGKSTTIGIISGLVNKTSGSVKVFDYDLDKHVENVKSCIGLVPQEFNFSIFEKVIDIVLNQAGYYGINKKTAYQRAETLLKRLHLWNKKDAVSRTLSGGMKRKLMIVRALLHEPKLLILDEPTAGVDVETRREMWEFLRELNAAGTTIILTTHYLEEAEQLCKNIAIINKGSIIENTDMKSLLETLDQETYIVNTGESITSIPEEHKNSLEKIDDRTLKMHIKKEQDLNSILVELDKHNIKISSMRNEQNRLEELFIRLTQTHDR